MPTPGAFSASSFGGRSWKIRRVPELLRWIQVDVDQVAQAGRWIIRGSHQPELRGAVAQSLTGRTALLHLRLHPLRGELFENLVISEAAKSLAHWGSSARICFFPRSPTKWICSSKPGLAVEIKSGQTIAGDWFTGLASATAIPALGVDARFVVYGGDEEQHRGEILACPWWRFPGHLATWLKSHVAGPFAPDPGFLAERLHAARTRPKLPLTAPG